MTLAYIGLGSNLDEPVEQIQRALAMLSNLADTRVVNASRFYRSPPMGPQDQPEYINAAALLDTALPSLELLHALQGIEHHLGRIRLRHWGERVIDLDLLLYGEEQNQSAELTLPHPGIAERAFVLRPLAELNPELIIPGLAPLADLLAARAEDPCTLVEDAA